MIHKLAKKFPKYEQFVLTSDLNRACVSISSNIAEGSGSESNREFKRYLRISVKSVFETISQSYIALLRKYITDDDYNDVYKDGELLVKKVKSFIKSLN